MEATVVGSGKVCLDRCRGRVLGGVLRLSMWCCDRADQDTAPASALCGMVVLHDGGLTDIEALRSIKASKMFVGAAPTTTICY